MASGLHKDLILVILQFLNEKGFKETTHMLEQESGLFFNMEHFEELVLNGDLDEVEKYLSGFSTWDHNSSSKKIFFDIRKLKYLEALNRDDKVTAIDILQNDLKVFASSNEDLYKELTQIVTLDNFRENAHCGDLNAAREIMLVEIKKLIEANSLFSLDKLVLPDMESNRLQMLINQSLNWQHSLCSNPLPNPEARTIFVDHECTSSTGQSSTNPNPADVLEDHEDPNSISTSSDSDSMSTATPSTSVDEVTLTHLCIRAILLGLHLTWYFMQTTFTGENQSQNSLALNTIDDLPKFVVRTMNFRSLPTSMDFHPIQHSLLLVGTDNGDIRLREVRTNETLASVNFQPDFIRVSRLSVRRILWSPDGSLFGVAYSMHMVQLFRYFGRGDIRLHLQIEPHIGSVNDIAFCIPARQLYAITCGDDKTIKVWDTATGAQLHVFEGHEAPVYSVCAPNKENFHINTWLYDHARSIDDCYAPGRSCSRMSYSSDEKRLFSCGTTREGESYMVEWNENEGTVKRAYQGFNKRSLEVVQFDTSRDHYLAAGDDYLVKFWDMDKSTVLATTNAEGGLMATPRIRFNKEGSLLAVSASGNRIKILATMDGLSLMSIRESHAPAAS
ncbi:hypothetical protein SLE2022_034880 [Rubroshorea leprosula]